MRLLHWLPILSLALVVSATGARAQDPKSLADKHGAQALVDSLKDVINAGADLFNQNGDYAGCYRVYQGGLLAVKPFLTPALQTKIDSTIAKAETLAKYSDRAFELRTMIDEIREQSKAVIALASKANEPPAPAPKPPPPRDPNAGYVAGKVTYKGHPAPPGFVTLVGDQQRFSASITQGAYKFRTPIPPGKYKIAVERTPGAQIPPKLDIPARFRSETTSGLTFEVRRGDQVFDIVLVP